ncbi:MAG: hypothetical protein ABUT20_08250, partial [Bacteroidota bacterium]
MKNEVLFNNTEQKISLRKLLSDLMPELQQGAMQRKSFFVNDIADDILVRANRRILAKVLTELLGIVSRNALNSCIRISAKVYHDVVLMHVKDNNTSNSYALGSSLSQVQPLVNSIGGFVDITSMRLKETTIAFSF